MNLEQAAAAVGAAVGQRKFSAERGLEPLRETVNPFLANPGRHPSDVAQDVDKLVAEIRGRSKRARVPSDIPSATLGRRLIQNGSRGARESWRAGVGAAALSKMTVAHMEDQAPGFGDREAILLRRALFALAAKTIE